MDRVRLSPENLNECPQKWAKQQSSDASFPNCLQELRKYHLRTTNLDLEQARTNKAFTSELDRPSADRQKIVLQHARRYVVFQTSGTKGKIRHLLRTRGCSRSGSNQYPLVRIASESQELISQPNLHPTVSSWWAV